MQKHSQAILFTPVEDLSMCRLAKSAEIKNLLIKDWMNDGQIALNQTARHSKFVSFSEPVASGLNWIFGSLPLPEPHGIPQ